MTFTDIFYVCKEEKYQRRQKFSSYCGFWVERFYSCGSEEKEQTLGFIKQIDLNTGKSLILRLLADGFARAISKVLDKNFGTVKMVTDSSQAALAIIFGLVFLGKLVGVREGTVIGALLIGNFVKLIGRCMKLEKAVD